MTFERLYDVWDFWDGIQSGFADFRGEPHYFESHWDNAIGSHSETFELRPIDADTIALVVEQAAIFRTWVLAFHRGEVPEESHPRNPGQNTRFLELDKIIRDAIQSSKVTHRARATFEPIPGQEDLPRGVQREMLVEWQ